MKMKWIQSIVTKLSPSFGGVPTFCLDPDRLLEMPEVREALRAENMTIEDWDGQPASLAPLKEIGEDEKPLLIVPDSNLRHIVSSCLTDFQWESVTIAELTPKFALEVTKSIPLSRWDDLLELHTKTRSPRNAHETALLVGRSLYGADTEFLRNASGLLRMLTAIAVGGDPLPRPIARAIAQDANFDLVLSTTEIEDALAEQAIARAVLLRALKHDRSLGERCSPAEQILVSHLKTARTHPGVVSEALDILQEWEVRRDSAEKVLEFGILYAKAVGSGHVSESTRLEVDTRFRGWLKQNYGMMLSAPNPAILRLPTLLERLDNEVGEDKMLLVVADSLSLRAWESVRKCWQAEGVIGEVTLRAAFAVLPTITSLSRRALFEGKSPSQFSSEAHSSRLERKLWRSRFPADGEYFSGGEMLGLQDSVARSRRRICLVDVSWDKRGHSINPCLDSIEEAAFVWARKTPLREVVRLGLEEGYRVMITSDHGQVECRGNGRPKTGSLPDDRSKRVLIFEDKAVCESFESVTTFSFHPSNLPLNSWPLFPTGFVSFDIEGAEAVSHGGLSMEEALVPVVEVRK